MSRRELFPDAHRAGLDDRVAEAWDLDWPLPVPRFDPVCANCHERLVLKGWKFHVRNTGSKSPYRCDVRLKCIGCSVVPIYGVPVSKAMYDAAAARNRRATSSWIEWRTGKAWLAEAGFFDT